MGPKRARRAGVGDGATLGGGQETAAQRLTAGVTVTLTDSASSVAFGDGVVVTTRGGATAPFDSQDGLYLTPLP